MEAPHDYREPTVAAPSRPVRIAITDESRGDLHDRIAAQALEDLPVAIAVIDCRGNVLLTNMAARGMPAALGSLAGYTPQLMNRLEQTGSAALAATCGDRQFWFIASPLADREVAGRTLFTVTITEPAAEHPVAAGTIAQLCGLTPCEARTAEMILAGAPPKSMATVLGVSLATVKTHLHRVFSKSGTRGQADFARRMARVMPPTR